ncbi:hypothetical protein [Streptomyces naphthomycinicus]|uniref:hypothetical protein n=1 Tax=Streptomyces naphthomycinicus TaxID=2872625 RepID=UPI001CEC7A67|nr:hypothetical protein [Streptomyces sp. TML10]
MPDPSTTRLALYKSKSDGSELVNYSQDIGQNLDKLDAAVGFQACTSSTRPSSPYSGKPIMETDTSYRTYFSNGTSPASGSWVEIPNSSATYNNNLKLAAGKQLVVGGSTSPANIAVLNTSAGDDVLSSRLTGDTQSRFLIDADGTLNWGGGGSSNTDVNLYRSGVNILSTDDSLIAAGSITVGGDLKLNGGTTVHRNRLAVGAGTTVANTAAETVVGTMTIPAVDAVAGAVYRARLVANVSFLASATLTWRARLGGVAGALMATAGPTTLSSSAQTNKESAVEVDLICATVGAAGTWFCMLQEVRNTQDTGAVGPSGAQLGSSDGTITRDTTVAQDFVVTAQWGAASASNTLTARVIFERIA